MVGKKYKIKKMIDQKIVQNIVIIDLFAGTFSVTKSILEIQKKKVDFQTVGIFCLEYSKNLCSDFLKSNSFQNEIKNNKNLYFKIYQANILNQIALKKLVDDTINFINNYDGKIYGVFILAGPPCNNYSSFHYLNSHKINGEEFEKKQKISDRLVLQTISLFEQLKDLLSEKMPVELLIENPWSNNMLNLEHKENPFLGIEYSFELGLRNRPFFQKFLQENGGFLYTSKHFWCYYDYENFSKKPTAIFSTLKNIQSNNCTHKKHKNSIVNFKNAAIRGRWPKEFIQYVIHCFLRK